MVPGGGTESHLQRVGYHWPDGSYFVGQFQNDRLYGEGYYVWPNGVQQWGYWKEDHYVGIHEEAMETRNRW